MQVVTQASWQTAERVGSKLHGRKWFRKPHGERFPATSLTASGKEPVRVQAVAPASRQADARGRPRGAQVGTCMIAGGSTASLKAYAG